MGTTPSRREDTPTGEEIRTSPVAAAPGQFSPAGMLSAPATRLLHIGVHKSGTTSLQSAFNAAKDDLGQYGVTYRGGPRHQPAIAVTGARGLRGAAKKATMADWDRLVSDVRTAGDDRVVVSSEYFSNADEAVTRRVVSELSDAGGPLQVVITLRPLYRIAPSQWQQYVQNAIAVPYVEWLDGMLCQPPYEQPTPTFWRRHHQSNLVKRWAAEVGAENVTVVVVDENDPGMLMRVFESFVGLPDGLLVPQSSRVNRSLTVGEAELVRRLNGRFKKGQWGGDSYARFVRNGVVRSVKIGRKPAADEPKLQMPRWALERTAEIGTADAEAISSLGVNVIGDLSSLGFLPDGGEFDEDSITDPSLPVEVAASAAFGAIEAGMEVEAENKALRKEAGKREKYVAQLEAEARREPTMDPFRATALAGELGRRVKRRVLRGVGR